MWDYSLGKMLLIKVLSLPNSLCFSNQTLHVMIMCCFNHMVPAFYLLKTDYSLFHLVIRFKEIFFSHSRTTEYFSKHDEHLKIQYFNFNLKALLSWYVLHIRTLKCQLAPLDQYIWTRITDVRAQLISYKFSAFCPCLVTKVETSLSSGEVHWTSK